MCKPVAQMLLAVLLWTSSAAAADRAVHWADLGLAIAGRSVSLRLADGSQVKGSAVSVGADSLVIATKKGQQSVARSSLREIRVSRSAPYKWRLIGASIGAGVGAGIAIPVLAETHNEGSSQYDAGAAGLIIGLAAIGYFAGWVSDRKQDVITILPD